MNKPFSSKELAKLSKICKNDGVSMEFYENGNLKKISKELTENQSLTPAPQARASAKKASQITENASLQSQYDLAREALETLQLEDPSAYEALLMQGALGEEKIN
jgi:hypothetical protein